ncbi:MAG: hypothetical protein ABFE01_23700 [Phycisphaerales bacterium]
MAERCDLRRLGRVDALVTAVACLLLVLLVPVLLAKPREQSVRVLCAANLSQIGKTMLLYAGDNEGVFPRPGGQWTQWGPTTNWMATSRTQAFRMAPDASGGWATISSSFYLLVKYYQMPPRLFLCRGDRGAAAFNLSRLSASLPPNFSLIDAWDFGPQDESFRHCSFSYHYPYSHHPLTTSGDPNLAVAADRNPFIEGSLGAYSELRLGDRLAPRYEILEGKYVGNAIAHGQDGQNVLFLDGRVTFETRPSCAVDGDNIYLVSIYGDRGSPGGIVPAVNRGGPYNERDSLLVNDPNSFSSGVKK